MQLKTKYQYTYFIHPYIVNEKKYDKYLLKLLSNKNYKIKNFDKEKDSNIYTYFLPKIRNYMFWTLENGKIKLDKLKELDRKMQAAMLAKFPCMIFDYEIKKDIQGKVGRKDGIFFSIAKIELICFNTGICFLLIKTNLEEGSTLEDVCNFNYKFRGINSNLYKLTEYDNIKIQSDIFENAQEITSLIKEIVGNNVAAKELNIDTEKFITYSYACIGQENYNSETNTELLEKEFYKYSHLKPASYKIDIENDEKIEEIKNAKYIKYACSNYASMLLTSDIQIDNYTKLPHMYENEYLYNFVFELYKDIYLKKINNEFKITDKFQKTKRKFIDFTKKIWAEAITNDDIGQILTKEWEHALNLNDIYARTKEKYDILYKNFNIEKITKINKGIILILAILLIINIISLIKINF